MTINEVIQDRRLHEWAKFAPSDNQYVKYAETVPWLIAAARKIDDVYSCFADARACLVYFSHDDYGDLCDSTSDLSKTYAKISFLSNAVLKYAVSIDLSWQVTWVYLHRFSFEDLMKGKYDDVLEDCKKPLLDTKLIDAINGEIGGSQEYTKLSNLQHAYENFSKTQEYQQLRKIYNYIKHRGTLHFSDLGEQDDKMLFLVNGKKTPLLKKPEYTAQQMQDLLCSFHGEFEDFFDNIINLIIPPDYFDTSNIKEGDYNRVATKIQYFLGL